MKLLLVIAVAAVSVSGETANDKDVAYWKAQEEKNQNEDLDKWPAIVASGDAKQVHSQLVKLQDQVLSACNNLKSFVPKLGKAVSTIHYLADGGAIKRVALRGTVGLLYGKRDNKSYYLLDGAHNWITLRTPALKGKNDQLSADLNKLDGKVVGVRDELDTNAAKFVASLARIHDELQAQNPNPTVIKESADQMYNNFQSSPSLLQHNQELIDEVNHLVKNNH